MKNKFLPIKLVSLFCFIAMTIGTSCKYTEVPDASYPDQAIYMTTAATATRAPSATGFYQINAVSVPGQPFRYVVDPASGRLNVNLGVGRSGVSLDGDINVSITANADTVNKLLASGRLAAGVLLLPASAYTLPPTVSLPNGSFAASFPLSVDLNFLLNNPNQQYAIGVGISSSARVTPNLNTTIVLINTAFLFPVSNFTFAAEGSNPKRINFTNTSANGLTFNWNFGDGTPVSTERTPFHIYSTAGTYNVTLTVVGVAGNAQASVITKAVTVN